MKKQTKADKAFIEKIKTLGINTGKGGKPECPSCGKEMQPDELHYLGSVTVPVAIPVPAPDTSAEQSFSM